MSKWTVSRYGSNAANQPMEAGPVTVAEVEAGSEDEACRLAAKRVTVYNNQRLDAELTEEVEAREAEIDSRVKVLSED